MDKPSTIDVSTQNITNTTQIPTINSAGITVIAISSALIISKLASEKEEKTPEDKNIKKELKQTNDIVTSSHIKKNEKIEKETSIEQVPAEKKEEEKKEPITGNKEPEKKEQKILNGPFDLRVGDQSFDISDALEEIKPYWIVTGQDKKQNDYVMHNTNYLKNTNFMTDLQREFDAFSQSIQNRNLPFNLDLGLLKLETARIEPIDAAPNLA